MSLLTIRKKIRPIVLPVVFSSIGYFCAMLLRAGLNIELSKLEISIIVFVITTLSVSLLFPRVFKIPFGRVNFLSFYQKAGLKIPEKLFRFILLGVIAASFTLFGMLFSSVLTGKYEFSSSTINLSHTIFSLTPGIWEEILFRGILMIVLIRITKSFKKAAIIQIVIFSLLHIKGLDLLSFVDAFSVGIIAIAFTYIAYKTKSLIPGIIFHFLHDTFIFAVQLPDEQYVSFQDNLFFYATLWFSVLLVVFVIKRLVEKYNIINEYDFYQEETDEKISWSKDGFSTFSPNPIKNNERKNKRLLLINAIALVVPLLLGIVKINLFLFVFVSIFTVINLFVYIAFKEIRKYFNFQIHIYFAVVAFSMAYSEAEQGSKYAYLLWIVAGFLYLIAAFRKKLLKNKIRSK